MPLEIAVKVIPPRALLPFALAAGAKQIRLHRHAVLCLSSLARQTVAERDPHVRPHYRINLATPNSQNHESTEFRRLRVYESTSEFTIDASAVH